MVNNAGIAPIADIEHTSTEIWHRTLAIHLDGTSSWLFRHPTHAFEWRRLDRQHVVDCGAHRHRLVRRLLGGQRWHPLAVEGRCGVLPA
ncbi:MAG: hypothetical protein R2710_25125 [Acidimicrobiales bacterium]